MAKATIKSKSGVLITVQGTHEEIVSIIGVFEGSTAAVSAKGQKSKVHVARKEERKRAAASDLVISLKEDGFFDKPKGLTEIANALEEKGYLYPVTTLSGVMLGLVQKKLLGRKKLEGRWVYGK
jgi:hypothetical protein